MEVQNENPILVKTENDIVSPEYSIVSPRRQQFSLPLPLILYLLETESPHLLLKLHKSCKYFFAKQNVVVCDEKMKCYRKENEIIFYCRNWLQKSRFWLTALDCTWGKCYSLLRPHIYRLTLDSLRLSSETLSLADINFLLSNYKMSELHLSNVYIRDDLGNPVLPDYILEMVPYLTEFSYGNPCVIYSNQALEKLNSISHKNKLKVFALDIHQTSEEIDAEILCEFLTKNLASAAQVEFYFPRRSPEVLKFQANLRDINLGFSCQKPFIRVFDWL